MQNGVRIITMVRRDA